MIHPLDLARSRMAAVGGLLWLLGTMLAGIPGARASANHLERVNVDGTISSVARNSFQSGISSAERTGDSRAKLRYDTLG